MCIGHRVCIIEKVKVIRMNLKILTQEGQGLVHDNNVYIECWGVAQHFHSLVS